MATLSPLAWALDQLSGLHADLADLLELHTGPALVERQTLVDHIDFPGLEYHADKAVNDNDRRAIAENLRRSIHNRLRALTQWLQSGATSDLDAITHEDHCPWGGRLAAAIGELGRGLPRELPQKAADQIDVILEARNHIEDLCRIDKRDDLAPEAETPGAAGTGPAAQADAGPASGEAAGPRDIAGQNKSRRKKRRTPSDVVKPLTPRQLETMQTVAECKGNLAEAARRLGIDRKTAAQHNEAALAKLGKKQASHMTKTLKADRRGQADIAAEDDRRQ